VLPSQGLGTDRIQITEHIHAFRNHISRNIHIHLVIVNQGLSDPKLRLPFLKAVRILLSCCHAHQSINYAS
jgi:hypothetical protein